MNFASKLLLGSLLVLVTGSYISVYLTYTNSKAQLREEFAIDAENLANNLTNVLSPIKDNNIELCELAKQFVETGEVSFLSISKKSKLICSYGEKNATDFNLATPDKTIEKMEKSKVYTTFASINCGTKNCTPIEIELGISFSSLDKNLKMLRRNQIWTTVVQIIFMMIFLFIFSYFVRRRLEILSKACAQIQKGNFILDLNISGSDEISKIGTAMNHMAHDLHAAAQEKDRQRLTAQHTSKMTALGEMAAGIAHEINNPLMIISGKVQNSIRKIEQGALSMEDAKAAFEKIDTTATRIARIISGLKLFSRNGEKDPMELTSISKIITETIDLCGERFKKHGVKLEQFMKDDCVFNCRAVQISQVLLNLFNNSYDAIQHYPNPWIRIETELANNFIKIRVTDCGTGIAPDILEKLMQPFFTTKEIGKGTGLGLSVSNGIVSEHGGRFYYELFENHTSFVIHLPINGNVQNSKAAS